MEKTVFQRIMDGEIPSVKLHEDNLCVVILDIAPVEKGHALVISREPYPTFSECPSATLGHMMEVAKQVAAMQKKVLKCDGCNILINNGKASGQAVPHLHIHVIPRFDGDGIHMEPPKKSYEAGEQAALGKQLEF